MTPRWTALIAAGILPALGLLDAVFAVIGGNAATFSVVLLLCSVRYWLVPVANAYSFGVFLGHVYLPSAETVAPTTWEALAWMCFGLTPVFAILLIIASGEGGVIKFDSPVVSARYQVVLVLWMLAAIITGMAVGRFILPQHPLAVVPA